MKTQKTSIHDFLFLKTGSGSYKVTYISPKTGKQYSYNTTNMRLIDCTKNAENPKIKDLNLLKKLCKK